MAFSLLNISIYLRPFLGSVCVLLSNHLDKTGFYLVDIHINIIKIHVLAI
jgi:hypothetical protein